MLLALLPAFGAEPAPTVSFPTENEHTLRLLGAHRVLKYTTTGALVLTAGLGVVSGINQPTLFGDGRCLTGDPVFGAYGCESISLVHAGTGVLTTALYWSDISLSFATPRRSGLRGPFQHGRAHKGLTWVHISGMFLQPILGLVASNPAILGIPRDDREDFSRVMRTVHVGVGVVIGGTYVSTLAIEEGQGTTR